MAISQAQKIDLLFKQAFGVTKTDLDTNKSPSNESIPSPMLIRGDNIWAQSAAITSPASEIPGIVEARLASNMIECIPDTTTIPINGVYPTWKTNLNDWIPPEFSNTYITKVYVDNPGAIDPSITGTRIYAAGNSGFGEYYFNYMSGVLNFIGNTIPSILTGSKRIYIAGYRYIGIKGISFGSACTGYEHIQLEPSTLWNIVHAKNTRRIQVTIYDDNYEQIIPETIKLINTNEIQVSFVTPVSGVAIITAF